MVIISQSHRIYQSSLTNYKALQDAMIAKTILLIVFLIIMSQFALKYNFLVPQVLTSLLNYYYPSVWKSVVDTWKALVGTKTHDYRWLYHRFPVLRRQFTLLCCDWWKNNKQLQKQLKDINNNTNKKKGKKEATTYYNQRMQGSQSDTKHLNRSRTLHL